jgi:hypothetical protein
MANVRLKVGKTNVRTTGYPSEPYFVNQVNAGIKKIMGDLNYIFQQFEDVTPQFMYDALKPTFDKTQERVPVDSGALKASGYLEIRTFRGNPEVEMGYGRGGFPFYTVYVHEMVEIPHAAPTEAKFMERPINEDLGDIIDRLASQYKEFMGP